MAISDCVKCWETPCSCGWEYRNITKEAKLKLAAVILGVEVTELSEKIGDLVKNGDSNEY